MPNSTASASSMMLACAVLLAPSGCDGKRPTEARPTPPQAELRNEAPSRRRRVRVPVVVSFDASRLEIASASVRPSPGGTRGVELALDDTALGIPLIDQLRHRCTADEPECVVWMEGYWGALVESRDEEKRKPPPYPFAVLRILQHGPNDAANVSQDAK